jgi:hypothetical protein
VVEGRARRAFGPMMNRAETSGTPGGKPEESAANGGLDREWVATQPAPWQGEHRAGISGAATGQAARSGSTGEPLPYRR